MGRQAKLRQQRKQADRPQDVSQQPDSSLKSRPALKDKLKMRQEKPQKSSLFGKVLNWLNPFAKNTEDLSWLDDEFDFMAENSLLIGAMAWEGFQKRKRGLIWIQEREEDSPTLDYIGQRSLKKHCRKQGIDTEDREAIAEFVKSYDPETSAVVVYCHNNGERTITMAPLEIPPPECYEQMQQESA